MEPPKQGGERTIQSAFLGESEKEEKPKQNSKGDTLQRNRKGTKGTVPLHQRDNTGSLIGKKGATQ